MPVKFEADLDSKHFENKLRIFSSGLGNIFNELLKSVGGEMADEAKSRAPVRTGKLRNAIKFITTKEGGTLTTMKTMNKSNIWYARMVESGANIKPKKGKYLTFKIGGEWKKVSSVQTRPHPFGKEVFNEYWDGTNSKGYQELSKALERKINEELK
jgi:HK97 gp10 family phage protein